MTAVIETHYTLGLLFVFGRGACGRFTTLLGVSLESAWEVYGD